MRSQTHRKNYGGRGFSLIELMFCVAIIGVLSAIAIPVYMKSAEKSENDRAIADIYQIQGCIEKYYSDTFSYPETLADVAGCLPNNGIDPWGKPYVYLNLVDEVKVKGKDKPKGDDKGDDKKRKDKNITPINTLYDLYSKGKDGLSKQQLDNKESLDDIVLGRDGGFVGLASDF